MTRTRAPQRIAAALSILLSASALTGCMPAIEISPWVVADHDEKAAYHADAGDKLLNLDAAVSLAKLEAFQATGYLHVETAENGSAHFEYQSSVDGESYVSQRVSAVSGDSFDQSHVAGSSYTYFLLGDRYKQQVADGKSWVQVPVGDLDRMRTPEANCTLYSVTYLCGLVDAWNLTQEENQNVPVQLSRGANGEQHFATAVSFDALAEVELIPADGEYAGFITPETRAKMLPLHLWVDADGVVTKIEVNGVLTGENDATLKLQIGFELTAKTASQTMQPVADTSVPANDVLIITTREQLDDFLLRLNSM